MPYIASGQSQLYYETYGDGVPILFAHGVGGNHASWFNQIPELSKKYRCITFDHRGFGNSTDIEGKGRDGFRDDMKALLDGLGLERAILVAQSMGGGTCLSFACSYPGRVMALALCDTLAGMKLPEEIRDYMAGVETATRDLSQAERVLGPLTRKNEPERTLLYLQIASFNATNGRTLKGKASLHTPEELAATGIPTLFLAGSDDNLFPPRAIRCVHQHVSGSRYVEIEGVGHSAYFEAPKAFNRHLLNFLHDIGV
jgi:pimeloyl-ACP methyl ester carboxylesterase